MTVWQMVGWLILLSLLTGALTVLWRVDRGLAGVMVVLVFVVVLVSAAGLLIAGEIP